MRLLNLEHKAGFQAYTPFIIYDNRDIEFYSSEFTDHIKNGQSVKFNLPKGTYKIEGNIHLLSSPVEFKQIVLPPKQRDLGQKVYKIMFGKNPNKCTIFHKTGIILFDNAFKIAPKYILYDIYFHELGHRFYKVEKFADLYATKRLLEIGFNPSQIGRSSLISLSSDSIKRKKYKINSLNKIKKR